MANKRLLTAAGIAAALALAAGCSVHNQETPSLAGPSGLGNTITITVSPDVLTRDGASQSLVTVTSIGPNGQPTSNQSLRLGVLTDTGQLTSTLGTLSAQNLVTNGNGQATAIFTSPAPILGLNTSTVVEIGVVPAGTDFGNSVTRVAQIQLMPQGIIVPPFNGTASFTANPASPGQGDNVTFTGKLVNSSGADISSQVSSFTWTFGDGGTATGQSVTHAFNTQGGFLVTMTAIANGSSATAQQTITVGPPIAFTPTFFTTPASTSTTPVIGQSITFNASANTPPAGHTITGYIWDFGDGSGGATGAVVSHTFTAAGTYVVLLRVTLDNGASGTASQTMTINPPIPHAVINLSPPTGAAGQVITFLGNSSTPAPGRTLVNYTWNFGDGSPVVSGSASSVAHAYAGAGTYTVTLLVTDDQGNQDLATASITIK